VQRSRPILTSASLVLVMAATVLAQSPASNPNAGTPPTPPSDVQLVERVIATRKEYQQSLEALRAYYLSTRDLKRAKWAEEELIEFHRIIKEPFRMELDVPPPTLKPQYPVSEANELYRRAMTYKDKGWGNEYIDNQHRAEILLQELLTKHPQSDKISDAAYMLGDIYEGKAFKQPHRAAVYFERVFQWSPTTLTDARLRAARLYDLELGERSKAMDLYKEVLARETDQRRTQEAQRRLLELSQKK
jgi:tetratricopeptide (TPR) repeat protein